MLIIRMQGGLGNQLYEYSMYEKLKSLGKEVYLDKTDYTDKAKFRDKRELELEYFDCFSYELCTEKQRKKLVDDKRTFWARVRRKLLGDYSKILRENKDYMPEVFDADDKYLIGWWNCEKYYEDIIPMLQKKIVFPKRYNRQTKDLLEKLEGKKNTVSIHIRLGDYVEKSSMYGNICTDAYYQAAIAYIEENIGNPEIYLFSDEPIQAAKMLGNMQVTVVDWNVGKDSMYDMLIQSKCAHNICANSTFSMWGARLNTNPDKIMIRPLKHDNKQKITVDYVKETWKNWIIIDEEGIVC